VDAEAHTWRWTRQEYDRLIEVGLLQEDDPIELIEGRLVVAEPQHDPHARAVELAAEALRRAFGRGWRVLEPSAGSRAEGASLRRPARLSDPG
jgi:hypothetical protein